MKTKGKYRTMQAAPLFPEIAEAPKDGCAFWIHATDKTRLRVGVWNNENHSKGTILVFPGRSEYVEKYGRTVTDLTAKGYSVLVIDWRGQGLADRSLEDRMTGHVARFSEYQLDVNAMVEAANELALPKPWYLLGHSLGASIGLRALQDGLEVSACAFTAPMWDIKLPAAKRAAAWPLSWAAQATGFGHVYAPGTNGTSYVLSTDFEKNRLTSDPEMYDYFIRQATELTDHQIGGPSLGWLFQTLKETKSQSNAPSPNIPCIVFCGDDDQVVDLDAVRDRMQNWANGELKVVENAKHDLFSEIPSVRNLVTGEICRLFA